MAASIAFPPNFKILTPVLLASGWAETTAPLDAITFFCPV
jgi:hypothetical protein